MKTLYLDCSMGAAGDMLTAALLELHPHPEKFIERLNNIGLENVNVKAEHGTKCGITGTHVSVLINGEEECAHNHSHEHMHTKKHDCTHPHDILHSENNMHICPYGTDEFSGTDDNHSGELSTENADFSNNSNICGHLYQHDEAAAANGDNHQNLMHEHMHQDARHGHHHAGMHDIESIVNRLTVPNSVKTNVMNVYSIIAQAESEVHGRPVSEVHFHEVGAMDAVADITAVCMLIDELKPERIISSYIHVGSGSVRCAHGVLPVPAPATARMLIGIPTYGGEIEGELCTPTGAALLKYFVNDFGAQPIMRVNKIGYGLGKKDFERANCVRALMGETEAESSISELCCNMDDITPEAVGYATERLFEAGALDVYTIPVGMKKNRPGVLLCCMCKDSQKETMLKIIFRHTTTLGVREYKSNRYTLDRSVQKVTTEYGDVRIKISSGWGVTRRKAEYDDLAGISKDMGISIEELKEKLKDIL
ncbi:MAG TPA: nickel pincer cofactor biosynthesis protein LarC [Firmicutes bacterium]|nr:nickel pincer cofactor biosynthesis protein LarC [Bacillota bacterium]